MTQAAYWPSAFALALMYGLFFAGGAGYRIFIAVAFLDEARWAPSSWSAVTTATALAALAVLIPLFREGEHALLVLAAYAVAINAAYIPAKFACLEAHCCHAQRRDAFLIRDRDLRWVEIVAGSVVFTATLSAIWLGLVATAAILGIGGHLAVRFVSGWSRNRLPGFSLKDEIKGQELLPLALLLAVTVWIASAL